MLDRDSSNLYHFLYFPLPEANTRPTWPVPSVPTLGKGFVRKE